MNPRIREKSCELNGTATDWLGFCRDVAQSSALTPYMPTVCTTSRAVFIVLTILSSIYLYLLASRMDTPTLGPASQVNFTDHRIAHRPGYMLVDLPNQGQVTQSYWLNGDANPLAREGADSAFDDANVDAVVIGSGITGVSAAHHLVRGVIREKLDHLKIVLLEARDFCEATPFVPVSVELILAIYRLWCHWA
jgi:hypothetical protein